MSKTRVIYKSNPLFKPCPACKAAGTLRKSHSRNAKEKIIKALTFFNIFRCKECGWRGYLSNFSLTSRSIRIFILYVTVFLLTAIIVSRLLKYFV